VSQTCVWTCPCDPDFPRRRSGKEVETLNRQKIEVCCVHETRWKGSDATMVGRGISKYKFFWQGCKDGNTGVWLLILGKWIEKVVDIKRVNEHMMCFKVLVSGRLVTYICPCAPQTGRSAEESRTIVLGISCSVLQETYQHQRRPLLMGT